MHYSSGKFIREGISTQNPEYYGWTVGYLKPVFYKQFMVLKSLFRVARKAGSLFFINNYIKTIIIRLES